MGYDYYFLILGTKNEIQEELEYSNHCGSYSCCGIHWFFCNRKETYEYIGDLDMGESQYIFHFDDLSSILKEIKYKESFQNVKDTMNEFQCLFVKFDKDEVMKKKWCELQQTFEEFENLHLVEISDNNDELQNYVNKAQDWMAQGYTDIKIIYGIDP